VFHVCYPQAATLCNDATIKYSEGKYKRIGEPTEAALKVLVEKIGIPNKVGLGLGLGLGCASRRVHTDCGPASFCLVPFLVYVLRASAILFRFA
jgi:hypothetical protein